ncbi:MAG: aspartate kinase [Thermoplasmata archaeon]
MRAVVKFGGADLSEGRRIKKAARLVYDSNYDEKVVVVSAMGNTTDNIEELIKGTESSIGEADYADILSMGERLSARMFSSALKSLGARVVYFDPTQNNWPIRTDSNFMEARIDYKKTRALVKKHVGAVLKDTIPVVCGFLGRCGDRITLLGRGGSDITATLLANTLDADEVILVKDTDGVLSADPDVVKSVKSLEKVDICDLFALAHGGGRVIHPRALEFKTGKQKLRIVPFSSRSLSDGGTEIIGGFDARRPLVTAVKGISGLTAIGNIDGSTLKGLFSVLERSKVYGISTGRRSLTVFIYGRNAGRALRAAHKKGIFEAISHMEGLGVVEIMHPDFINLHGIVAKITNMLAAKNLNIIEVSTSKASIDIFLREEDVETAKGLIGDGLEI